MTFDKPWQFVDIFEDAETRAHVPGEGEGAITTVAVVTPATNAGQFPLQAEGNLTGGLGGGGGGELHWAAAVQPGSEGPDLDVDSDNTNGTSAPDRSAEEEEVGILADPAPNPDGTVSVLFAPKTKFPHPAGPPDDAARHTFWRSMGGLGTIPKLIANRGASLDRSIQTMAHEMMHAESFGLFQDLGDGAEDNIMYYTSTGNTGYRFRYRPLPVMTGYGYGEPGETEQQWPKVANRTK